MGYKYKYKLKWKSVRSELSYAVPTSVEDAVKLLAGAGGLARVMAGGTDLLVQLCAGRVQANLIVDLKQIAEITGIHQEKGGWVIGAATPGAVVCAHQCLKAAWPRVVEAMDLIGSTQVQSRCSLGGNLCNASPAADSVPAMLAAGATAVVVGPQGRRELAVEQIPTGPSRTCLAGDEFILGFKLPARPVHSADAYLRLTPRTEMDIAVAGCGISVTLNEKGVCTAARLALGAVAPTAILVPAAADALVGHILDAATLTQLAAAQPISDKRGTAEYRRKIVGVLARRCAAIAFDRAMRQPVAKGD